MHKHKFCGERNGKDAEAEKGVPDNDVHWKQCPEEAHGETIFKMRTNHYLVPFCQISLAGRK